MTTQADELKELIREGNGVRKDLERERKAVVEARREAENFVANYVLGIQGQISRQVQDGIEELLAQSAESIRIRTEKQLSQINKEFQTLKDIFLGKKPVPDHVVAKWQQKQDVAYVDSRYYPDLEALAKAWPALSDQQRELCRKIVEGISVEELGKIIVSEELPDDVIHAVDTTKQVVSKLQKIRKQRQRVANQVKETNAQ